MGVSEETGRRLSVGEVGRAGVLTEADERAREQSVPDLFAERVAKSRDAVAFEGPDGCITYADLDARSNRVAAGLLNERATGPVGLLATEGASVIVGLLGVLKAGRIALTLDPRAPEGALAKVLAAARSDLVLGDPAGVPGLPVPVRPLARYGRESAGRVDVPVAPGSGSMLAFTSGSTGEPRGHLRSHRMLVHQSLLDEAGLDLRAGARVGLVLSPAYARTPALRYVLAGATVVVYETAARGMASLGSWLVEKAVEVVTIVPSMIDPLLEGAPAGGFSTTRVIAFGGEKTSRARADALRRLLPDGGALIHNYALTEGSRICRHVIYEPIVLNESPLPVGLSLPGATVHLRGDDGTPAETGEIVVESCYLSRTWDADGDPVQEIAPRMFSTGDLGTVDDEGRLSIVGRADRMVKIRGHRVQLDAVEQALLSLEPVRSATAAAEPSPRGTQRLVAYIATSDPSFDVKTKLQELLPSYAVPHRIEARDELPLLPGGKIDIQALARVAERTIAAPAQNDLEAELVRIWASVLELDVVGRDEEFLELGGDSLSAAIVTAEVYKAFGVELTPRVLDETPTVASMAATIDALRSGSRPAKRPKLPRSKSSSPFPLGLAQEIYRSDSLTPGYASYYNLAGSVELQGRLDTDALRQSVAEVVRRHDVLRTTLEPRGKRYMQIVQPESFFDWETTDLRSRPDPDAAAGELYERERVGPFDVGRDPPIRFRLWRTGEDTHELAWAASHTAADNGSWPILFRELAALYPAYREGRDPHLPELPLQFGDYCLWYRSHVRSRSSRFFWQELAWWRRQLTPRPVTPEWPFARPERVEDAPLADAILSRPVRTEASEALTRMEEEAAASFFVVRLAALTACLFETTRTRDLVVGVLVTARRIPELHGMIGPLPDLMPLCFRLDGSPTFAEWILHVRRLLAVAAEHTALSYAAMPWAFRGLPIGVPTVDVMAGGSRSGLPWATTSLPGLELRARERPALPVAMHRKLQLSFKGGADGERCNVKLDARRFDPALVQEFLDDFARRAQELSDRPDEPMFRARW